MVGTAAPSFEVKNQREETISIEQFKGKPIVLFFYPKDDTPTCTKEVCNLRDNYKLLQDEGFVVLGVSADSAKKHQKFIGKFDLPFDLLVDDELKYCNAYGCYGEKQMFGKTYNGIFRKTFLIDSEGTIVHEFEKVKADEHSAQILAAWKEL